MRKRQVKDSGAALRQQAMSASPVILRLSVQRIAIFVKKLRKTPVRRAFASFFDRFVIVRTVTATRPAAVTACKVRNSCDYDPARIRIDVGFLASPARLFMNRDPLRLVAGVFHFRFYAVPLKYPLAF